MFNWINDLVFDYPIPPIEIIFKEVGLGQGYTYGFKWYLGEYCYGCWAAFYEELAPHELDNLLFRYVYPQVYESLTIREKNVKWLNLPV